MRTIISLLALASVAACSSSSGAVVGEVAGEVAPVVVVENVPTLRALLDADGTGTAANAAFAQSLTAFEAEANELGLADVSNSRFDAVPTTGEADFAGFLQVDAGPTANLSAELELTADFGENGRITGDITSPFFAAGPNGLVEFEDDVEIVFGIPRARGIGNGARIDVEGTINNEAETIVVDVDAIIEGKFIGTPIVGATGTVNPGDTFGLGSNAVNALDLTLNDVNVVDGSVGFLVLAE